MKNYREKRELGWWGHLIRFKNARPVKMIWKAKPMSKRSRRRPKETWDTTIAKKKNKIS